MSDPKSKIATRVEVFTRATADALNRAIGEVLDARSPWQLLHRLSRIVFLGLVLYLGWILVVVQPDLTRRLMVPHTPRFRERHALHREAVLQVLQSAVATPVFGLHSLLVAEWDGASAIHVLAVQGRSLQQPLEAGDELLVGVALAKVLGHVALGLCESERPAALGLEEAQLPAGAAVMVCPIGCVVSSAGQGLLVAIQAPAGGQAAGAQAPGVAGRAGVAAGRAGATGMVRGPVVPIAPAGGSQEEQRLRRQREQLMVLARRLAGVMP